MSDSWGSEGGWASGPTSKPANETDGGDGGGSWGNSDSTGNSGGGGSWATSDSTGNSGGGGSWAAGSSDTGGERKGKGCFKCGQEGHMSRECPSGGGGGGGGRKGCFKCGDEGHMSRECPSGGSGGGGGRKGCFKCGDEGHMSRECPSGSSGDGAPRGGDKGCRKCGQEGHFARDCTEQTAEGGEEKPRAPIYTPPDLVNDASLYDTIATGENFSRYESLPCQVSGHDQPDNPTKYETFEEAFTSATIKAGLKATGIAKPTPIQKYGMRIVMAGRDLMACAQTGSGKTLAFILPILQTLFSDRELSNDYGRTPQEPRAVIVTPTRELALQIYREAYKFSVDSIVKVQIAYGGTSVAHQRAKLCEGTHILVGTPGRLLDFLDKGYYSFASLKYFVLDEADRMIDKGFIPDVMKMVAHPTMPPKGQRQTLMFSATFQDEVQRVAADFLAPDYLFLTVGILGAANSDVEQTLIPIDKAEKRKKLFEILSENADNDRTMVFVEAKKTADQLSVLLCQKGFRATSIHGDRFQHQREEALRDLKTGKFPVLVATSVAARGLDIRDVRHVINYDLPSNIDDYIHRIGRTGRVGNKGKATSFYDGNFDRPLAKHLKEIIEKASQKVPEWLQDECDGGGSSSFNYGDFGGVDIRNNNPENSTTINVDEDNWD